MFVVYTGKQDWVSLESGNQESVFDKGVPTYVKPSIRKIVSNHLDFVIADDQTPLSQSRPIFVLMPRELEFFLAALKTLDRIKENFPTCIIQISCDINYKHLLPKCTVTVNGLQSKDQYGTYYRIYDLAKKAKNIHQPIAYKLRSHEEIILETAMLSNPAVDKNAKPRLFSYPRTSDRKNLLIINKGVTINDTVQGLSKIITDKYKDAGFAISQIDGYDMTKLDEYIQKIANSDLIICCGDSPLMYIAGYMQKAGFVITKPTDKYNASQYERLGINGVMLASGVGIEEYIEKINSKIDSVFSIIAKEPRKKEKDAISKKEQKRLDKKLKSELDNTSHDD